MNVRDRNRTRGRAGLWAALWTLVIIILSLWPMEAGPGGYGADKVAHFLMYAFATALYIRAGATLGWAGLISLAIGLCMEVLQLGVPSREYSSGDLAANAAGTLAVLLWVGLSRRFSRSQTGRGG